MVGHIAKVKLSECLFYCLPVEKVYLSEKLSAIATSQPFQWCSASNFAEEIVAIFEVD